MGRTIRPEFWLFCLTASLLLGGCGNRLVSLRPTNMTTQFIASVENTTWTRATFRDAFIFGEDDSVTYQESLERMGGCPVQYVGRLLVVNRLKAKTTTARYSMHFRYREVKLALPDGTAAEERARCEAKLVELQTALDPNAVVTLHFAELSADQWVPAYDGSTEEEARRSSYQRTGTTGVAPNP